MFNKNLKLICTAIGLVAVLVGLMAMPGATQQVEMPTRGQIAKGLSQLIARLTASEGDILDFENAQFISHPQITAARIPLHPSSRSFQLWKAWLEKGEPFGDYLYIGALYLENDAISCPPGYDLLKAGVYHLKVRKDLKLIAVDSAGDEFIVGYVKRPEGAVLAGTAIPPIPNPLWPIIYLCATQDVNLLCIRHKVCEYEEVRPGVFQMKCREESWCIGC